MTKFNKVRAGQYITTGGDYEIVKGSGGFWFVFETGARGMPSFSTLKRAKAYVSNKRSTDTRTVKSLMTGKEVEIAVDTPLCCDPSSETYWSM